ncbi:hypothetical protein ACLOJK_034711 [Asimina triloba]
MTRRAHSFKRPNANATPGNNNNHPTHLEIDLPLNSPRSDFSRTADSNGNGCLLRKHLGSPVALDPKEKKRRFAHWMFLIFCAVCFLLGVLKISANGWFGLTVEREWNHEQASSTLQIR